MGRIRGRRAAAVCSRRPRRAGRARHRRRSALQRHRSGTETPDAGRDRLRTQDAAERVVPLVDHRRRQNRARSSGGRQYGCPGVVVRKLHGQRSDHRPRLRSDPGRLPCLLVRSGSISFDDARSRDASFWGLELALQIKTRATFWGATAESRNHRSRTAATVRSRTTKRSSASSTRIRTPDNWRAAASSPTAHSPARSARSTSSRRVPPGVIARYQDGQPFRG